MPNPPLLVLLSQPCLLLKVTAGKKRLRWWTVGLLAEENRETLNIKGIKSRTSDEFWPIFGENLPPGEDKSRCQKMGHL